MGFCLPNSVDKTPAGDIVPRAELGQPGYGENVEYVLRLLPGSFGLVIEYIGENLEPLSPQEVSYILLNSQKFL